MKIAFIGLGIMGRPMALNLLRGGHELTVWAHHGPAHARVDRVICRDEPNNEDSLLPFTRKPSF